MACDLCLKEEPVLFRQGRLYVCYSCQEAYRKNQAGKLIHGLVEDFGRKAVVRALARLEADHA